MALEHKDELDRLINLHEEEKRELQDLVQSLKGDLEDSKGKHESTEVCFYFGEGRNKFPTTIYRTFY
jgi:hypothetical protein